MPTIPMGNFGQSVIQPGRAPRVSGVEAGQITGKAIADLGQGVAQMATNQIADETKQGIEAFNRDAQTTAARVRITTTNNLEDAADALALDIKTGKVDKAKALGEWQARHAAVLDGAFNGVDDRYKGVIQAEIDGFVQRKGSVIRQAVTVRDQEDTRANLMTLGDEYQRMAVKDRPKAMAEYFAQIDAMGPAAGMGPDDITKAKQGFREGTAYTQATALVGAARDLASVQKARQALASDAFADVDPQKRATLEASLDGRKTTMLQRQAILEQRAAARAQVALSHAQAAFTASQARVDAGIPDSPEQVALTTQALAGTPFLDTYRQLQTRAREIGGFGAQPIAAQQGALDQVNAQIAQQGASDSLIKRRDALQKVLDASKRDYGEDALRAGLQRGVIDALPAIDISSADSLTRSIGQRLQAAQIVQTRAGRPVSPLTNDEALQVGQMLSALPVQQRSSALAALGQSIGPQAAAGLAAQIDKQDKALSLALQYGASKTTQGRYTSELILKGQQALKDKTAKVDAMAESGWRAQIAQEIGDAYPNQRQAEDVKESAFLIAAGMASEGRVDPKNAVRLAAQGSIVEHNGRKIPLPAQVSQSDFEERLRTLTPANFSGQVKDGSVRVGGQAVPIADFVKTLPDAQLISLGSGRFTVLSGGRIATNSEGRPITINAK
jgi:hypothetical protein